MNDSKNNRAKQQPEVASDPGTKSGAKVIQHPKQGRILTVSFGNSRNRGRITRAEPMNVDDFINLLRNAKRDGVTRAEYHDAMTKEQRAAVKEAVPWFVLASFTGNRRTQRKLKALHGVVLDIDRCTPELLDRLKETDGPLGDYFRIIVSTRSHTPEVPRVRVILITLHDIQPEDYGPLARIVAGRVDPTLDAVDPVSFRGPQYWYLPSAGPDVEPLCIVAGERNRPLPNAAAALGWKGDFATLPRSKREHALRQASKQAADPAGKRGIVGAFCRAYSIDEAIRDFLPDVYDEGDDGRYSFADGTTRNGAVVYDNGETRRCFLYSHHDSDPCGHTLVNAFDLMRLHKFGELDPDEADGGANPTSLPSYKAMAELARGDDAVVAELPVGEYDLEAMADGFDADDDADAEVTSDAEDTPGGDWTTRIAINENGTFKNNVDSVAVILANDPRFKGALRFNTFKAEEVLVRRIRCKRLGVDLGKVRDRVHGDGLTDAKVAKIRRIFAAKRGPKGSGFTGYEMSVKPGDLKDAIAAVCDDHAFSSAVDELEKYAALWDGEERLASVLHDIWGAADTDYHSKAGVLWIVGAMARAYEPGHKFDFMLVFVGGQGLAKSSALDALAGSLGFGELTADITEPKAIVENTRGCLIMEVGEQAAFNNRRNNAIKRFGSARAEKCRLAYGRRDDIYPRQFVMAVTANEMDLPDDPTGNRRFWPVDLSGVQAINLAELRRLREQLWGEAVHKYKAMRAEQPDKAIPLDLSMPADLRAEAERQQHAAQGHNPDADLIAEVASYLDTKVPPREAVLGYRAGLGDLAELDGNEDPGEPVLRAEACVPDIVHARFPAVRIGTPQYRPLARKIGSILTNGVKWIKMPTADVGKDDDGKRVFAARWGRPG